MPPRQWVQAVAGPHYVEFNEADICSGSAGSYNLKEPEMAARLQLRKTTHIRQSKAFLVITTNLGCILQIQSELKKEGLGSVRVMHLAIILRWPCVTCPVKWQGGMHLPKPVSQYTGNA